MKLPEWNGATPTGIYIFSLVCFVAGYVVVRALSWEQLNDVDHNAASLKPSSATPDGKVRLSDSAIKDIGFGVLAVGAAALLGLGLIWNYIRLS